MIVFSKIKYDKSLGSLKCGICGKNFKKNSDIYISQQNIGFICEKCMERFSKEELEEFLHLFNQYGGHFGKFEFSQITLEEILNEFFDLISYKQNEDIIESNLKLRHKALLHGFTPKELIEKMWNSI